MATALRIDRPAPAITRDEQLEDRREQERMDGVRLRWQDAWIRRQYEEALHITLPGGRTYVYTASLETDVGVAADLLGEGGDRCDDAELSIYWSDPTAVGREPPETCRIRVSLAGFDAFLELLEHVRESVRQHEGR